MSDYKGNDAFKRSRPIIFKISFKETLKLILFMLVFPVFKHSSIKEYNLLNN